MSGCDGLDQTCSGLMGLREPQDPQSSHVAKFNELQIHLVTSGLEKEKSAALRRNKFENLWKCGLGHNSVEVEKTTPILVESTSIRKAGGGMRRGGCV